MNAKLDSMCKEKPVYLGTQRCECLFKSGELLNRHITQGPSRKTKITPGIKKQEVQCRKLVAQVMGWRSISSQGYTVEVTAKRAQPCVFTQKMGDLGRQVERPGLSFLPTFNITHTSAFHPLRSPMR